MSHISQAYDAWSAQYDDNLNPTRDLEGAALQQMLHPISFASCLELGCGTGKNTGYLLRRCPTVTGVDFSEGMLQGAREKWSGEGATFIQADLTLPWSWASGTYDLITTSLMLEHIEDLASFFKKGAALLNGRGYWYVGELHPFKQYSGSKARFDTAEGTQVLTCYTHHFSDYFRAGSEAGLSLTGVEEFFDTPERSGLPRVLGLLFRKA